MERSLTPKGQRAREKILVAAQRLLVARGFHGASMRDIAAGARLPLATVVYHFARKEQIYAAVLGEIASSLEDRLDSALANVNVNANANANGHASLAAARVDAFLHSLLAWATTEPEAVKLLLRELLDNPARVAKASRLPLAPFLERASALVADYQRSLGKTPTAPETCVLHIVGALSYHVAAWPTVERIVGEPRARQLSSHYETEALAFARRVIAMEDAHEPEPAAKPDRPRPRSPRAPHDR